jgi:hypothetical protein
MHPAGGKRMSKYLSAQLVIASCRYTSCLIDAMNCEKSGLLQTIAELISIGLNNERPKEKLIERLTISPSIEVKVRQLGIT